MAAFSLGACFGAALIYLGSWGKWHHTPEPEIPLVGRHHKMHTVQ